jgi:exosortase H (IPTLxxWG-CTERM-specific)
MSGGGPYCHPLMSFRRERVATTGLVDRRHRSSDNQAVGAVKRFLASPSGRFLGLYALVLTLGFVVLALRPVNDRVVNPYTTFVAEEARAVLNLFGEHATVTHQVLASRRFSVAIYNGCNGLEAILIFVSGVLAFPARWRRKLVGIALGFLAIQVFNVVRVVSLFYIGAFKPRWFSLSHVFVWQSLVIVFAVVLWLVWVRRYALADARY